MAASDRQSSIIDMSPTSFVGSNHFFKIEFQKCARIIKQCCTTMVEALENAALSIDHVQEIEIMEMEYVAKYVRNTSTKLDGFPPMMKEVYDDHIMNKVRNTILISF